MQCGGACVTMIRLSSLKDDTPPPSLARVRQNIVYGACGRLKCRACAADYGAVTPPPPYLRAIIGAPPQAVSEISIEDIVTTYYRAITIRLSRSVRAANENENITVTSAVNMRLLSRARQCSGIATNHTADRLR